MLCEIEFLPVGKASRAGDAIIVRYGDPANYQLMLVDGGHTETADQIIAHLRAHFGSAPVLEHVVLTHSDGDHACGLRGVLDSIKVKNLWLHVPWFHAPAARPLFADNRWTDDGLAAAIRKEYGVIVELLDQAEKVGAKIN
jgi:beta-lactamase superfamily II metal-dependent hydrolase